MDSEIKLYKRPRLKSPIMLAAWPGIGNVSLIVLRYLAEKLRVQEMGEIEPYRYFDPTGVWVADNVVESPQFPESKFYYWKNRAGNNDLIFFLGDAQPLSKGYELAGAVLDVAQSFRTSRIYTCAAAITQIHHSEKPKVWAVVNDSSLLPEMRKYDVVLKGNLQIAGLNGLLLGVAKEIGVEGVCLLGEVPSYATRMDNPKAALWVLKMLTQILQVEIDLSELKQAAVEAEEVMKQVAAKTMAHFIDHFTVPYWEKEEED